MRPPRPRPLDLASDKRLQEDAAALYHEVFLSAAPDRAIAILKKALLLSRISGLNAAIIAGKAHALPNAGRARAAHERVGHHEQRERRKNRITGDH